MNSKWNARTRRGIRGIVALSFLVSLAALVGCSGGSAGSATGKVTAKGAPVTAGTLTFAPSSAEKNPGAPASAEVKADGTYSMTAIPVGKNRVVYVSPGAAYPKDYTPKPSEPAPMSPFTGLVPQVAEVEVKAGKNTIDIELGPKK